MNKQVVCCTANILKYEVASVTRSTSEMFLSHVHRSSTILEVSPFTMVICLSIIGEDHKFNRNSIDNTS